MELDTPKLKKMSVTELTGLADSLATKVQWWHSTGKNEEHPERYKRLCLELYHVSEIIDVKLLDKKGSKYKY